jgi:membrane associated rhomboid family serine protease
MNLVLLAVIVITCLFSYQGFQSLEFFRKYEFHIGSIRAGDQVRMISSGFLHADLTHLAFNMLTLFFFAPVVIMYLDSFYFLLIYMGSLIFGNLLTLLFHKDDYSYRAIGASGAVTGVLYSAIMFEPNMTINFFIPAWLFGIIYLLFSIYGMRAKRDNIGHTAHFGGAIGGYVITIAAVPSMLTENTMIVILLAVPIILLFVLAKLGKI